MHLTLIPLIQQTSSVVQEPPIIPQDALPDSGVSTLPLASSSAPITDEVPRIQVRYPIIFRNSERSHLTNISFFLTRHKTVQTTLYSLFNLGQSVQKMRWHHQQNQLHYLKKPWTNSRKFYSCWIEILANWFKMPSWFVPFWGLWRVLFLNPLKKHCIPLPILRVIRPQSSKPRSVSLVLEHRYCSITVSNHG